MDCKTCYAPQASLSGLAQHVLSDHPVLKWTCLECSSSFKTRDRFFGHVRDKHLVPLLDSRTFQCPSCDEIATDRQEMRRHLLQRHHKVGDRKKSCFRKGSSQRISFICYRTTRPCPRSSDLGSFPMTTTSSVAKTSLRMNRLLRHRRVRCARFLCRTILTRVWMSIWSLSTDLRSLRRKIAARNVPNLCRKCVNLIKSN